MAAVTFAAVPDADDSALFAEPRALPASLVEIHVPFWQLQPPPGDGVMQLPGPVPFGPDGGAGPATHTPF